MEIEKWTEIIKKTKRSNNSTTIIGLTAKANQENTKWLISKKEKIKTPTGIKNKIYFIELELYKAKHLTIFEVELIYMIFVLNKKPYDYASYHKCQAGKEFIENIKNITVKEI